jgi:hypothetical protein
MTILTRTLILLFLCSTTACSPMRPEESSREVPGTKQERVAAVSKLLSRNAPLPSPLLDAHLIEDKTGDNRLGSADFTSFCAFRIAPADLAVWRATMQPIEPQNTPPKWVAPKQPQSWWITQDDFRSLEFYSPKSLTGRYNGWVGIAPDGRIFVYSFTM